MDTELADRWIEGHHLSRVVRRNAHPFLGSEDVKLFRIENQLAGLRPLDRMPEFLRIVKVELRQIDRFGALLGAITDDPGTLGALQIERKPESVRNNGVARRIVRRIN